MTMRTLLSNALLRLAASPEDPVELLRGRLRSAPRDDPGARRVRRLVRDLDDDSFAVRQRAERELRHLGRPARGVLEEALRDRPTPEVRRRVERLLSALDRPGPDLALLRPLRAVEVLERSATPGARKLLEELASGEPDSDLTRAAKAALARLDAGAGRTHVGSPCR